MWVKLIRVSWPQHRWHFGLNDILLMGGWLVHCRIFNNISALSPLDASNNPLTMSIKNVSPDTVKYLLQVGGIAPVENYQCSVLIKGFILGFSLSCRNPAFMLKSLNYYVSKPELTCWKMWNHVQENEDTVAKSLSVARSVSAVNLDHLAEGTPQRSTESIQTRRSTQLIHRIMT